VLDELMRPHGGFDHNVQSLRIVELIEQKYPRFPGLNLFLRGPRRACKSTPPFTTRHRVAASGHPSPSLEAQIANLADEITYYSHDLDDGLDFQLITAAQLAELEVWTPSFEEVRRHFPRLRGRDLNSYVIRSIIDRQVQDVIATSAKAIAKSGVQSVEEVRRRARPLIRYSANLLRANKKLRRFLYANLYFHPRVAEVNQRACRLLREVFDAYLAKPALLGKATASRIEKGRLAPSRL
jgi:dGTPase